MPSVGVSSSDSTTLVQQRSHPLAGIFTPFGRDTWLTPPRLVMIRAL